MAAARVLSRELPTCKIAKMARKPTASTPAPPPASQKTESQIVLPDFEKLSTGGPKLGEDLQAKLVDMVWSLVGHRHRKLLEDWAQQGGPPEAAPELGISDKSDVVRELGLILNTAIEEAVKKVPELPPGTLINSSSDAFRERLSEVVQVLMAVESLTQADLARRTEIPPPALNRIIKAKRSATLDQLFRLAQVLRADPLKMANGELVKELRVLGANHPMFRDRMAKGAPSSPTHPSLELFLRVHGSDLTPNEIRKLYDVAKAFAPDAEIAEEFWRTTARALRGTRPSWAS